MQCNLDIRVVGLLTLCRHTSVRKKFGAEAEMVGGRESRAGTMLCVVGLTVSLATSIIWGGLGWLYSILLVHVRTSMYCLL